MTFACRLAWGLIFLAAFRLGGSLALQVMARMGW
jgi:hypothetical protein